MAGFQSDSTISTIPGSIQTQGSNLTSNTAPSTWSALFKTQQLSVPQVSNNSKGFFNLPAEIRDVILDHTCSDWGVTVQQLPYDPAFPEQKCPIMILPHNESTSGLGSLAKGNKTLQEHLKRRLYSSQSFSGYTQLVGMDINSLIDLRGLVVLLDVRIAAFWPNIIPKQFLKYILKATTVLEMTFKVWTAAPRRLHVDTAFPNIKRLIFTNTLATACAPFTLQDNLVVKETVRSIDSCQDKWAERTKRLVKSGIRITWRVCRNHPRYSVSHPMILSIDIKPISLPYHPANFHIRIGRRDFHSPCCPTGRANDPTLKFIYADLREIGLEFKPVENKDRQPCDICRHWRLMWAGANGDRKRFGEKDRQ